MKKENKSKNRFDMDIESIHSLTPSHKVQAPEDLVDKVLARWHENKRNARLLSFNPKKHWYWAASIAVFCLNLWALSLYVLPNHHMQATKVNREVDMSQVYFPNTIELEYIDFNENGN